MKNSKLFRRIVLGLSLAGLLMACESNGSTTQQKTDNEAVQDSSEAIGAAQPLPILAYSTQRQVMIESYVNMAIPNKPMYMIATHPGAGNDAQIPIIAYAVVKGCVPATYQLTQPSIIADEGHDYGYAILEQQEVNSMYTGDTSATYCIGFDGTFFSIEHPVSFSSKPFSEVLRSRAAVDFTPNLVTQPNGSVVNNLTGETLYEAGDVPVEVVPGINIDPSTNEITYDQEAIKLLGDTEQQSDKINTGKRSGR